MNISRRYVVASITWVLFGSVVLAAEIPLPPEPTATDNVNNPRLHSGTVRLADEKDGGPLHKTVRTYAQFFAYSVVQPPYNGEPEIKQKSTFAKDMNTLLKDLESYCILPVQPGSSGAYTQAQVEFADEFTKELAIAAKLVLDNATRPIERISIVRVLATASKVPGSKHIDLILSIINKQDESDALKLYAFQALRFFLEQGHNENPAKHLNYRDPKKLAAISDALSNYILQNRPFKSTQEQQVIEYVRREAVAALGRFKESVVRENTRVPLARPGYSLMRVLWDPELNPPVTIQERIEVLAGFPQMRIDEETNLDVATYFLGYSLVQFIQQANIDDGRMKREGSLAILPWKIAAARISFAFATWREAAKKEAKAASPGSVVSLAGDVIEALNPIEKEGPSGRPARDLSQWFIKNPPKITQQNQQQFLLYKDDPKSLLPILAKSPQPVLKTPDPKTNPPVTPGVDPKTPAPKTPTPPVNK